MPLPGSKFQVFSFFQLEGVFHVGSGDEATGGSHYGDDLHSLRNEILSSLPGVSVVGGRLSRNGLYINCLFRHGLRDFKV